MSCDQIVVVAFSVLSSLRPYLGHKCQDLGYELLNERLEVLPLLGSGGHRLRRQATTAEQGRARGGSPHASAFPTESGVGGAIPGVNLTFQESGSSSS